MGPSGMVKSRFPIGEERAICNRAMGHFGPGITAPCAISLDCPVPGLRVLMPAPCPEWIKGAVIMPAVLNLGPVPRAAIQTPRFDCFSSVHAATPHTAPGLRAIL